MPFRKIVDDLPSPKKYLVAGVPRPASDNYRFFIHSTGRLSDIPAFLENGQGSPGARTLTILDDEGLPVALLSAGKDAYLSGPPSEDWYGGIVRRERLSNGVLDVERKPRAPERYPDEQPHPIDTQAARTVTFDHSVVLAGIDRKLFGANDALFISIALELESAYMLTQRPEGERMSLSGSHRGWKHGTPVPIDGMILRIYKELAGLTQLRHPEMGVLDRTDLLCAATAIAYDSPMYSTKPDAYADLKNGLKVLEYGPVRNKTAAKEQAAAVAARAQQFSAAAAQIIAEAADAASNGEPTGDDLARRAAGVLQWLYSVGQAFDEQSMALLSIVRAHPTVLIQTLRFILQADHHAPGSWHAGVLGHAAEFTDVVKNQHGAHEHLLRDIWAHIDTLSTAEPENPQISALALNAVGLWGRWPDDVDEDILSSLKQDPNAPSLWRHYQAHLVMAGLDEKVIDDEITEMKAGSVRASRDRIEELRQKAGLPAS